MGDDALESMDLEALRLLADKIGVGYRNLKDTELRQKIKQAAL